MMQTWRLALVVVLAVAGVAISAHLTSIHYGHVCHGIPGSCAFSESNRCDEVNTSEWSEFAGIPVAHLGMLSYLLIIGVAAAGLFRDRFRPRAHAYLFLSALWCVLFSMFMAFISLFIIRKVCDWCVTLYGVNLVMLIALWPGGFRAAYSVPEHLAEDWRWARRLPGALAVVACAALLAGPTIYLRSHLTTCKKHNETLVKVDITGRPFTGPEHARVTVVEISDFECPFCRKASGTLANVLEAYKGRVKLVFMHFPLDQACNPAITRPFHKSACLAAKAAWCAGTRGFFWKYAKALFDGELHRPALVSSAKNVGFEGDAFEACLDSKAAADAVAKDIDASMKVGVHQKGVPYFIINGRTIVGAVPPAEFKRLIDEELAAAGGR